MQKINLDSRMHDEVLKSRMMNEHLILHRNNANNQQIASFEELHTNRLRNGIMHLRHSISQPHVVLLSDMLTRNLCPQFSAMVHYAYLDDENHQDSTKIIYNFEMIVSYRFEEGGYHWLSDGTYAFSPQKDLETHTRITNMVIDELKEIINKRVLKKKMEEGHIESVDAPMPTFEVANHRTDAEPTGL